MINDALEFIAKKNGNVVVYDSDGNPSIYVPFNKCLSSELDASLPAHVHPAFIMGDSVKDRILIGKYKAASIEGGTTLFSIPGKDPANNLSFDTFLTRMRAFKTGASGLTIADHGLILLTAKKMGWQPKGNNNYGAHYADATKWADNTAYTVGNERAYRGWLYKCLIAHTSSAALAPENNPAYWEKERQIGGTMSAATGAGTRTLTGSGPADWYLGGDVGNIADVQGNVLEQVYGYRIVDGEIQIMANNDAALPTADLSSTSAAWKAILPGASASEYTLVAPGTAGTLHWCKDGSGFKLDTSCTVADETLSKAFTSIGVNSTNVPVVPCIMQELGLLPVSGDSVTQGTVYINLKGERVPRRSGLSANTSDAGMGYLSCYNGRSHAADYFGARGRFVES